MRTRAVPGDVFGKSVCHTLAPMRSAVVMAFRLGMSACREDAPQAVVVPVSIGVSPDRRTVTVMTSYPRFLGCAKQPGGLQVKVEGDVATVTAKMERSTDEHVCTVECGYVTQALTLDQPLAEGVRFANPQDADPGCAGGMTPVTTTTLGADS